MSLPLSPQDVLLAAAGLLEAVREDPPGSNRGAMVEAIQRFVGGRPGDPWCAQFVSYVGARVFGKEWPLRSTGSCDELMDSARSHKLLYSKPKRGDVFLLLRSTTDAVHTGFIERVDGDTVWTIEGNTIPDRSDETIAQSREGWGVFRKRRSWRRAMIFARPFP